jgi:hypothetical protein
VRTPANGGGGPPPAPVAQAFGPASAPLDPPELLLPEPLLDPLVDPLLEPLAEPELLPPDPLDPDPEPEPPAPELPPESTGPGPAPLDPLPHAKAVAIRRGRPNRATRAELKDIHASV